VKRCALFAREIVERKLSTVGPLPDTIDRQAVYARVDALAEAAGGMEWSDAGKPG
jgi:hypothetical protein